MNMNRIKGIFFRYLYVLKKGPQQLCDLFYWPLIDILLWGLTAKWIQVQNDSLNLPLIMMTGLIFWQVIWRGSVDISVSMLQEFWHRNLINLFSTPLKLREWIAGMIIYCLFKLVIAMAFSVAMIHLIYSVNVLTIGWIFIPFAASLLLFGWTLGFFASSLIIYWMIGFLFAPFSAVFYPVSILPGWAQTIAWCLPTTYIFEAMRSLLTTGSYPHSYFWISLSLGTIYLIAAIKTFYYAFEKSRAKGLARLE
jgi:ABC-2 type transport system permease protein